LAEAQLSPPALGRGNYSGNGGDGKSLLALQLGVAVATVTDWIGYLPAPGGVLVASAEDEHAEIHRRVADIIAGRDELSFAALGNFNVIDLSATDALLVVMEGRSGALKTTPVFGQIEAPIVQFKPPDP
jgi:RecA-family ATPase